MVGHLQHQWIAGSCTCSEVFQGDGKKVKPPGVMVKLKGYHSSPGELDGYKSGEVRPHEILGVCHFSKVDSLHHSFKLKIALKISAYFRHDIARY